jgi:4-diphosphocytidyl-2-C-methyl-D-erythritol kinase
MITLKAPAKINWSLDVVGKRDDGYHEILSLMQCITLGDSLVFEHSDALDVITDALIPPGENLVHKAMLLLKKRAGVRAGARITLNKEIPLAAGLGGGSSDAASALLGLNLLWDLGLTNYELAGFGEGLGSDVPFFFDGPAAVIEGRGETVSPVSLRRSHHILLVKPHIGISSAWAYAELDSLAADGVLTKKDNNIKLLCQALERGDFSSVSSLRGNDLEQPVIRRYPVIAEIKAKLLERGALFSSMSGSGPTVYGVFESEHDAFRAMEFMLPHWCRTASTVTESGE